MDHISKLNQINENILKPHIRIHHVPILFFCVTLLEQEESCMP